MAVKRGRKTSKSKSAADAYEQTVLAEGAPLALDLLGLGSTISDLVTGKLRKAAKKKRAKKKARAKVGRPPARKARAKVGRATARKARAKAGRPLGRPTKKKAGRKARRKNRRA